MESTLARAAASSRALEQHLRALPAEQQPNWANPELAANAANVLHEESPLVRPAEVEALSQALAKVATGGAHLVQAGDCAEPLIDMTTEVVSAKVSALHRLGAAVTERTGLPVVHIGRIAGQYAKPRSAPFDIVGGEAFPAYRGCLVNDARAEGPLRQHDAARLVWAMTAARSIQRQLRRLPGPRVWSSHEALVLDYELPQLVATRTGRHILGSAHTVWIGARTNSLEQAHVALAAAVDNPVACKVGPNVSTDHIRELANRIDPHRTPGRLTLIARMGAAIERLPSLVRVVRDEGHPAIWLTDPMHGNTVLGPDGRKTRYLDRITHEFVRFQEILAAESVHTGGVHLETTIDAVNECLDNDLQMRSPSAPFTSLCDPRLTTEQALAVISHWDGGES
ncbi:MULTISPECIES: 3-deoxy-7-phosphoheptulonate synthase [unclassified Micromonospora]|uniref:3-deoxy-7-phosphoheptulonate synthase n=1 Tax=unclassified Micromonospora TaxID=2617518 RepID=UPI00363181F2